MPIANITAARDAIIDHFKAAWDAMDLEVGESIPEVIYDDAENEIPDGRDSWVRVSVRHAAGAQATLGGVGGRRFRKTGDVTVYVFTPVGGGLTRNDALAKVAVDAFEGESTGGAGGAIVFRNVRSQEIGRDGAWFQTNVIADFEYDGIK